ncbi:MAG: organomercurial lyase, partial [Candidatus Poribacteria bacterium]
VANGQSVTSEQLKEIASKHKISLDKADSFISEAAEYDDDGNIVGIFGLSQKKHPHRFRLRGYSMSTATFHVHARLSTWCAWDSLFLSALLNQTAEVESTCPQTNDPIRLTISPEDVKEYEKRSTCAV